MSKMRVIFNVGVMIDVAHYTEAGAYMDRISDEMTKIISTKGNFDITSFQTRPCKAIKFEQMAYSDDGGDVPMIQERSEDANLSYER